MVDLAMRVREAHKASSIVSRGEVVGRGDAQARSIRLDPADRGGTHIFADHHECIHEKKEHHCNMLNLRSLLDDGQAIS